MTRFRLTQIGHDLRSSMLLVPAVVMVLIAVTGFSLAQFEVRTRFHAASFAIEPATAQAVLATLAGSMMTVVSVVYSVLLVALSLASMQFSTRILAGMVRDRVSQLVLGLFLGTFAWQLVALRALHFDPAYVPPLTVSLALLLALASLGALVVFIDRIIHGIQANHLVDRIARETELVIDSVYPARGERSVISLAAREPSRSCSVLRADRSGYVQLVSADVALEALGGSAVQAYLLRPVGSFIPEKAPLWAVSSPVSDAVARGLRAAVDIGPVRTMQDDVAWGLRQIVDIGLKAISPAVNDPSTGALCIDHLARLLIRAGSREPAITEFQKGDAVVVLPVPQLVDLIDLAFDQLRQYGKTDMSIALRVVRAIGDVAEVVTDAEGRARLGAHLSWVDRTVRLSFSEGDQDELQIRVARVQAILFDAVSEA